MAQIKILLSLFYENMFCLSTMMISEKYVCVCMCVSSSRYYYAEPIWYKNELSISYTPKRVKHEVVFIKGRTVVCSADIRMYDICPNINGTSPCPGSLRSLRHNHLRNV